MITEHAGTTSHYVFEPAVEFAPIDVPAPDVLKGTEAVWGGKLLQAAATATAAMLTLVPIYSAMDAGGSDPVVKVITREHSARPKGRPAVPRPATSVAEVELRNVTATPAPRLVKAYRVRAVRTTAAVPTRSHDPLDDDAE